MMETDKLLHVLCGYVIAVTIGMWLPWLGAVAGIVAAFGKEFLWDRLLKRGTFEWCGYKCHARRRTHRFLPCLS